MEPSREIRDLVFGIYHDFSVGDLSLIDLFSDHDGTVGIGTAAGADGVTAVGMMAGACGATVGAGIGAGSGAGADTGGSSSGHGSKPISILMTRSGNWWSITVGLSSDWRTE